MNENNSESRQKAIKELINKRAISDQNQLVELLSEQYDIKTNQAVVSRDLRKLGVTKKLIKGTLSYEVPDVDITIEILRLALIDISYNESMIVIKTQPALADFVGDFIDNQCDLDALGCLSGENIVFVSPISTKNIHKTYEQLCEKLHFKKKKDM